LRLRATVALAEWCIALAHNAAGDLIRITDALNNATQSDTDELSRTTTSPDSVSTGH
jgi:hypothetical protein